MNKLFLHLSNVTALFTENIYAMYICYHIHIIKNKPIRFYGIVLYIHISQLQLSAMKYPK